MTTEHKPHSERLREIVQWRYVSKAKEREALALLDELEEQYEDALRQGLIIKERVNELEEQLEAATNDASHLRLQLADAERDVSSLRSLRDDVERPAVLDTVAEYRAQVEGLQEQLEALRATVEKAANRLPDPMHPDFPNQFVDAQVDALMYLNDALEGTESSPASEPNDAV